MKSSEKHKSNEMSTSIDAITVTTHEISTDVDENIDTHRRNDHEHQYDNNKGQ